MIVVVSGFPRSGTTAMCAALKAGGLEVVTNPDRTTMVHLSDDGEYLVQPGDLYECTEAERRQPNWPRQHDGKVVKVVTPWLGQLAVHDYVVVFMRRDPEEIRQSVQGAFRARVSADYLDRVVAEALLTFRNRKDVRVVREVWYRELLNDPIKALRALDLGLDLAEAAGAIDPACYRFRREHLLEGV